MKGEPVNDIIIESFIELQERRGFNRDWIEAFLRSMEMDLKKSLYRSLEETKEYMYGSAEVIGLFMSSIMDLPRDSYPFARMQGRSALWALAATGVGTLFAAPRLFFFFFSGNIALVAVAAGFVLLMRRSRALCAVPLDHPIIVDYAREPVVGAGRVLGG